MIFFNRLESKAYKKFISKSLINIVVIRIHICPRKLAWLIFAGCSLWKESEPVQIPTNLMLSKTRKSLHPGTDPLRAREYRTFQSDSY